jgi:hypothetical protein
MRRAAVDVLKWARSAEVGARITYHIGPTGPGPDGPSALVAHAEGLVFLAQRKLRKEAGLVQSYAYEATRVSTPCAVKLRLVEPVRR